MGTLDGRIFKERRLDRREYPVTVQTLWPRPTPNISTDDPFSMPQNRFVLRLKNSINASKGIGGTGKTSTIDAFLAKFLQQPQVKIYFFNATGGKFILSQS